MPAKVVTPVINAPTFEFLKVQMTIHLSRSQTDGDFALIEAMMPPDEDGGLHMQTREDELIHLLEGELHVTTGQESLVLKAGQYYFAPRNISHYLRNRGSRVARALLINAPGTFDEFIQQAGVTSADAAASASPPDPEEATQTLEQVNPIREPPPSFNDDRFGCDGEFVPP
jgi:mannose-6-phosphate isomerase-like protein (cupin superfamily)